MNNNLLEIENNFIKNGFEFHTFKNAEEVNIFLEKDINKDVSLYFGGSKTVDDIESFDILNDKGYNVNWHWKNEDHVKNKVVSDRKYYITSSNAITEDGKLVNMDGIGNRVAAMITGYERVYVLVGKNKLVANVQEGRERIKKIAAPLNAKRLHRKTPCVKTGICMDCDSKERICCAEVVLHRNPMSSNVVICLLDEEFGF